MGGLVTKENQDDKVFVCLCLLWKIRVLLKSGEKNLHYHEVGKAFH